MPDVQPREYNATFQQAKFLSYSPALAEILKPGSNELLHNSPRSEIQRTHSSGVLAVYGRAPDPEEAKQTKTFLDAARGTNRPKLCATSSGRYDERGILTMP